MTKLKFLDLFAGIGGFHIALEKNNMQCIGYSEIDANAMKVYSNNFNSKNFGDIKKINTKNLPDFDFIAGGFPCQPFSKAGKRKGFLDPRGTLFFDILEIIKIKKPKFILLENVKGLITQDNGKTYETIKQLLINEGYVLNKKDLIVSPLSFGIPQARERIFIPAIRKDLIKNNSFDIKIPNKQKANVFNFINPNELNKNLKLSKLEIHIVNAWGEFVDHFKGSRNEILMPVWIDYFKKSEETNFDWKNNFIKRNNNLYKNNKVFIDKWMKQNNVNHWPSMYKKMEWNCKDEIETIYDTVAQFRSSGVRFKKPDTFPTILTRSKERIFIPKYMRYLSVSELAYLQSFPKNFKFDKNDNITIKQLGNAVNVDVVKYIVSEMLKVVKNEK